MELDGIKLKLVILTTRFIFFIVFGQYVNLYCLVSSVFDEGYKTTGWQYSRKYYLKLFLTCKPEQESLKNSERT